MKRQINKLYSIGLTLLLVLPFNLVFASSPQLYIALDTSSSMRGEYEWIEETLTVLREKTVNYPEITKSIALYSFTDQSDLIMVGDESDMAYSLRTLLLNGGVEDGLIPIEKIVHQVEDGAHILLITDESRSQAKDINIRELRRSLQRKNIKIHAILGKRIRCKRTLLVGFKNQVNTRTAQKEIVGITNDFKLSKCQNLHVGRDFPHNNNAYIDLALATGGTVWNLHELSRKSKEYGAVLAAELIDHYSSSVKAIVKLTGAKKLHNPVTFSAEVKIDDASIAPITSWQWDFNSDGVIDDYGPIVAHIFAETGKHKLTLTLSNDQTPPLMKKQTIEIEITE